MQKFSNIKHVILFKTLNKICQKILGELSFYLRFDKSWREPNILNIEITTACNLRCPICPYTIEGPTRGVHFIKMELFRKIVEMIKPSNEIYFLHFIGEPLLHPDLKEIIECCHQYGHKVGFFTNALTLDSKKSEMLLDVELDRVVFSFETEKKMYDRLRIGGNYEKVKKNILTLLELKAAKKVKRPITIMYSISDGSNRDEPSSTLFWKEKVDIFYHKALHDWSGGNLEITKMAGNRKVKNKNVCKIPWSGMLVLVDGRVVPCCVDYNASYVIGDIKHQTFDEIWNGKELINLRHALLDSRKETIKLCSSCTYGQENGDVPGIFNLLGRMKNIFNLKKFVT